MTITTFLIYFGWGVTTPLLPLFGRDLGASEAMTGLLVAAFSISSFSLLRHVGSGGTGNAAELLCVRVW